MADLLTYLLTAAPGVPRHVGMLCACSVRDCCHDEADRFGAGFGCGFGQVTRHGHYGRFLPRPLLGQHVAVSESRG